MFAGKEVRVFLKGQAKETYLDLKSRDDKESLTLLRSIDRMRNVLKGDPQFGDPIKKMLIPAELKKQGIRNLYRAELSYYWRMLYTIEGNDVEILLFVLNIVDHKIYNKIFGYQD